jgi:membrane associated rhomboid family serine protease
MRTTWEDPPGGGLALPRPADATRALLIANGAIWFAVFLLVRFWESAGEPVVRVLRLDPDLWVAWWPLVPIWQLLTYGFLHAPLDVGHILFNLLTLYFFGTAL